MKLRLEVALGVGALLVLQLGSSFAAIGLLGRTSLVADRLMADNVTSLFAIREMLAALADSTSDDARFADAFRQATANITEPDEPAVLKRIDTHRQRALTGDPLAAADTVDALAELAAINERSMVVATAETRWLGLAGTWSAVLLGGTTFTIAVLVYRRIRTRIEDPVIELDCTLVAARAGDARRRCMRVDGPLETRRISENVNWVLDRLEERSREGRAPAMRDRAVLLHLLDQVAGPVIVVSPEDVIATNTAALATWTTGPSEVVAAVRDGRPTPGWSVERLEEADVWVVRQTGERSLATWK